MTKKIKREKSTLETFFNPEQRIKSNPNKDRKPEKPKDKINNRKSK